jgi:hypothetical protein
LTSASIVGDSTEAIARVLSSSAVPSATWRLIETSRRVGGEAVGAGVGEAGVEIEPRERADFGARRVAGVGDAAQTVEDRVVGVEAAGDGLDFGPGDDLALEGVEVGPHSAHEGVVEGGGREYRVTRPLQVEIAVQGPLPVDIAVGEDFGHQARFGTETSEHRRGGEELRVGGERTLAARGAGADRLAGVGVDDEEAAGTSASPQEARLERVAELLPLGRVY